MTAEDAVTSLRSPDTEVRQRAADDLRADDANGVRPFAVPALLSALASEPEPDVRGAILLTLGRSGAEEAKAAIDDAIASETDPHVQRAARRALTYWRVQNGEGPSTGGWSYWVPVWHSAARAGAN
jgi:HEAT repeat protein